MARFRVRGYKKKGKKKNIFSCKLIFLYFQIKALQQDDHNDLEEVWEAIDESNTNILKLKNQV